MHNTTDNIRIAKFTGMTFEKNIGWYDNEMLLPNCILEANQGNCFDNLMFDKSWDWLMTAAEECLSSGKFNEEDSEWQPCYEKLHDAIWSFSMEATYRAVMNFINWYEKT